MGQMRFIGGPAEQLPREAVDRIYLAGIEGIPWRSGFSETGGTRTHDLRIKSPLLYRLSYDLKAFKSDALHRSVLMPLLCRCGAHRRRS